MTRTEQALLALAFFMLAIAVAIPSTTPNLCIGHMLVAGRSCD